MSPTAAPAPAAFVDELCKQLVAGEAFAVLGVVLDGRLRPHGIAVRDGFSWPVVSGVPGLVPLAAAFDRVLVRTDGLSLEVVCLQDRLAHPERRVALGVDALIALGAACLPEPRAGAAPRMLVQVWEVGAPGDHQHLAELRHAPGRARVGVAAAAFGPGSDDVWSNAPPLAGWARPAMARRALRAVRAGEPPTAATPIGQDPRPPAVTYALLALLAAVYLLQLTLGEWRGLLTPTGRSLLAMGALQRGLVLQADQWYRVAAATLLHGSPVHLLLNGVALFLGGRLLEPMIGRGWFAAVYGLSALGGSLGSMLLNPAGTVSVGASGAIVGLFGAALAVSHRMPYGAARAWARTLVIQVLLPSVLPIVLPTGSGIDFAGHLGGAVVGLLVGVFLVARWPRTEPHPRDRRLGAALAVACGLALAAGLAMAISLEPEMARLLSTYR